MGETCQVSFVTSAFNNSQLPDAELPEIAFAGRSNVGKSSLINKLINRRSLVKVSSRPGKTQSLNYFRVGDDLYLVDLPGYGFAKVPRKIKNDWQGLITSYLEKRETLCCVVVIIDVRHPPKPQDRELVGWLQSIPLPFLLVYTKSDKLSRNQANRQARILDAGFNVGPAERVVFSAKTGDGLGELISSLERYFDIS
ncbi:MAG: ribosome biogenesis GTP-binding protein YihA/YsxC [Proteobacteria bacterium]|nr:ribosome biogenesis GTP-binding protein YihA/YsxC [Pseudomonadota bacterium]MBU1736617.1 ribosome biogenesis GTP-binding protein YihA/YsxC [Pseudomonadota bacterium]